MILPPVFSSSAPPVIHALRLRRGADLLESIQALCREKHISSGAVLCAVGCISEGRVRAAGGITICDIPEHCEIVSLNGTVSEKRCHLHISLSREDLSTIGGHLCEGCIINTTCELIIAQFPGISIEKEFDTETGYHELVFGQL